MSIIFEKLRYKNFLGAGNSPIEIQLDRSKSTLIIGSNGSGKSSGVLDGIHFALFGKPFRDIKKNQLINTINNKQCVVEIWFSIGSKKYRVVRGIKPDVFEIYCDSKIVEQVADARDHQRMLEEQILHMNSRTFSQVVLLSVANFKPFMQLDAKDRRDVIEDILDIRVFSAMNQVLKEKNSTLREHVNTVENNIEVNRQKIDIQRKYIETLNSDQEAKERELTALIESATKNISDLESRIEDHAAAIEDLDTKITDDAAVRQKRNSLSPILVPLKARVSRLEETIEFYASNSSCPTCLQDIDSAIKDQQTATTRDKMTEVLSAVEKLNAQLEAIQIRESEILEVKRLIATETTAIQQINSQIIAEQTYIRKLNNELNSISKLTGSIDAEKDKLSDLSSGMDNLIRQKSELSQRKQYLDIAGTLLKDSGIKTRIIEQYLPVINKLINKYLEVMGVWISFHLDGEFKETIKARYRDTFTYNSFSEGEKQRIDLAILFTWRTIAKMKNSVSSNLLVMDEILDKCLDFDGVEQVVQLLDTLGEGTNIFVISHKVDLLYDKFHSTLAFEKHNNFSQIRQASALTES